VMASLHRLSARVLANESTSPFEVAHGEDAWSFLAANPAHSHLSRILCGVLSFY
jgi:hypothetical protein